MQKNASVNTDAHHEKFISFVDIEQQVKQLPANERARLAETLLESLKDDSLNEIHAAWQQEIEQRVDAYDRGDVETFFAAQVFTEARLLNRRSF